MNSTAVVQCIRSHASKERARISQTFFKTGKGEYSEGDIFCGVRVPVLRTIAKEFRDIPLSEATTLLHSPIHEERMVGLYILIHQYERGDERIKNTIAKLYLRSIKKYINNWDLVDTSAEQVIGEYVVRTKNSTLLTTLARSKSLWERRVAMIATFYTIKKGESKSTIAIANILLHDSHDLIQKAVGWMLREMGKRGNDKALHDFLDAHAHHMPRTMLRYAIERLPQKERVAYRKQAK